MMETTQSLQPRAKKQAKTLQPVAKTAMALNVPDVDKVWTTVGSAGTLDEASVGKVFFDHGIVQMGKLLGGTQGGTKSAELVPQTQTAVIRYNVTPVDGLFTLQAAPCKIEPGGGCFFYALTVRCLAVNGKVTANLIEIDLASGAETVRLTFQSTSTPSHNYEVQPGSGSLGPEFSFDFVNKAYYIEATLTASSIAVNSAAGIQIIKIVSGFTNF